MLSATCVPGPVLLASASDGLCERREAEKYPVPGAHNRSPGHSGAHIDILLACLLLVLHGSGRPFVGSVPDNCTSSAAELSNDLAGSGWEPLYGIVRSTDL